MAEWNKSTSEKIASKRSGYFSKINSLNSAIAVQRKELKNAKHPKNITGLKKELAKFLEKKKTLQGKYKQYGEIQKKYDARKSTSK